MEIWASFNADGFPTAFYIEDLFPQQPERTVEITYEQWRELVENQGYRKFTDGQVVPYDPPPAPLPVPGSISDRQFFQELAIEGRITNQEALDAVKTGAIPSALQTFVDGLEPADKFNAEMLLSGATVFERDHPLTIAIGTAQQMSAAQIDDFFRAAGAL